MLNKKLIEQINNYIFNKSDNKKIIPLFFNDTNNNIFRCDDVVISSSFNKDDELRSDEMFFSESIPRYLRDQQCFSPTMEYLKKIKIKPASVFLKESSLTQEYLDNNNNVVAQLKYAPEDPKKYLFLMDKEHLLKIIKTKNLFLKIYISISDEELIDYFKDKRLFGLNDSDMSIFKGCNGSNEILRKQFNICLNDLLKGGN